MGYLIDPTEVIYTAISNNPEALKSLQQWWDEPLRDAHGLPVPQNRAERIEGLTDWLYVQFERIEFHSTLAATVFDMLTDPDGIDWEQLEYKLFQGGEDED